MSDYVKITNYAAKDVLLTGNPSKLVKGTEIGAEFDAVAVAVASKVDEIGGAATNLTLTTPVLGVATATSINGNTWTAGTGTLTLGAGKTLTASNTLTLTATDGSTLAVGTGGTLGTAAYTAATAYQPADADLTTWAGITPGANVGTALAVAVGSAGAFVTFNGAGGTPSSLTGTNLTGTAAGLTAGNVTTNANLTGHVTSVGNAAVLGSFTHAQLNTAVSDANVAAAGANSDITALSGLSGNIAFTGTGNRITGDFSNATVANRVMFQTSTVNGNTLVEAIPNGTGTTGSFRVSNANDPTNASVMILSCNATESLLQASRYGTGTYLPMTFYTGGAVRMRIDTSGNVLVTNPAGLGYGTGAGGAVTQATSKATAVTLNKPTGRITTASDALAAGARVGFIFNNSLAADADLLAVTIYGSTSAEQYSVVTGFYAAGQFYIMLKNETAGSLSTAVGLSFAIIKGAVT